MIRADATLDTGGFLAGLKAMDSGALKLVNSFKAFSTVLPGLAAIIGAFKALHGAVDMASELHDLAANTGQSVADLTILQQALKDSGVSANATLPILNYFQAALGHAGDEGSAAAGALDKLGVSVQTLRGQSLLDQLQSISKGLEGVTNQADRAAILKDLFGKKGAKLGAFLGDAGSLDQARKEVGGLPEVLERIAPLLDAIGDTAASLGIKFSQFAVGALEGIGPPLQVILEAIQKVDFTGLGQAFGRIVGVALHLLYILEPVLEVLGQISKIFGEIFRQPSIAVPGFSLPKQKLDEMGLGDKTPVSHLASIGGAYAGNGFGMDLGGRIDRSNDLLGQIRDAVSGGDDSPPSAGRPDVPV